MKNLIKYAGGTMGLGLLGGSLQPHLPSGITNPLTSGASTMAGFTPTIATLSAGGIIFRQFKKIEKKVKGGKK